MDESDGLENRCASHFCHQRLGPMKEAPSLEGAFLVLATPLIGKPRGWVLVTVGVCLQGAVAVLTLGHQCFFGNTELSVELWIVIAGISGFDD